MVKQGVIYLIISMLVVIFKMYAKLFLSYIDFFFTKITLILSPLLTEIGLGNPLQKILLLVVIPIMITSIPGLIYYIIKQKRMPYFFEITWCIWLIIVLSHLLIT